MVIEFVGLPGTGKSTTARALEAFGFERMRITSKRELLMLNVMFFFKYPCACVRLFFTIVRTSIVHGRFYPLFMNAFLDTQGRIIKAQRTHGRHAIVDQGYLQGLLSMSYHALTEDGVRQYMLHFPKPDMIIFFEVHESMRTQRLTERGYGVREGEANTSKWLQRLPQNAACIKQAGNMLGVPFHVLNAAQATQDIVEEIKRAL
jgi:thymidylate kinase